MFKRITFDSEIMGGRACIRGMRIPVSLVVNLIANGMSEKEILAEYPDLEGADIQESLRYAAWRQMKKSIHIPKFEYEILSRYGSIE